ncbi:MAG: HAMP domain-containing histidine kinase [Acidobacteria bacterium]|nr:HAMP domain-containing histidine kinase [Acidobacteriota bacterium]
MREFPEILRRNRALIILFTVMVILPSMLLGLLGLRTIRSESAQQQFQQKQRQRQIARFLETDLKGWLFSRQPDGAIAHSLLRFTIDGSYVVFPDFQIVIPPERYTAPVPFASSKRALHDKDPINEWDAPLDARMIEDLYYPRIQAFLRDQDLGKNLGAQYFLRLKALIVQFPGTSSGYVLGSSRLVEYAKRRLDELTAPENFRGIFSITAPAGTAEPALSGAEVVTLDDFAFFRVAFTNKESGSFSLQRTIFLYSIVLMTLVMALGVVFMYRAVSHEMAASQLKADFVSAVSHEFRTPLSSMLALLERLESGRVSEGDMLGRYHQTLRQEAHRLGALIEKLLDFAQIEEGKRKFSFERLDLAEVTAEAASLFQGSGFAEHLEQIDCGPGTPTYVVADRTAIVQCVQNLIENALKYSPPGSPVSVRFGQRAGTPFVEVRDQGIGIPGREQQKIFEKFYRAENARSFNVHGTGIGLALVKRIMEAHGGSVAVQTTPGKGSCFCLLFGKLGEGDV